ncbi:SNF2-related protein [Gracilibacillus sp. YIM 98692]|uniref:DEAD/DEAH box helicase n=1 Tax=Gracilibacillus sp. YIM 98692 TaxID=2663532 RepID=UPI0013D72A4C|nr:SNF2-related protein [Gracilibacillus sp. YIM 98692]
MQIPKTMDKEYISSFTEVTESPAKLCSWELFQKSYQIAETMKVSDFNQLVSPSFLPKMDFLPHQIECAERVIQEMNGRALLADEVGLGKTIEAGLILKEYLMRGMAKKVLILVPASLVNQWALELSQKFYIPAVTARKRVNWKEANIIITTLDTAKKGKHQEEILNQSYDFVIVDEAHKLKNHQTKNFAFVQALKKKYLLLLTATPVQNKLTDIFNLISLIKPGYLGTYEEFVKTYRHQQKKIDDDPYLKQLVNKVMIRNRRKDTGVQWTNRHIDTIWVDFSEEEQQFYNTLEQFFQSSSHVSGVTYKREFCSSREACYLSLKKWINLNEKAENTPLLEMVKQIEHLPHHAKAKKLVDLVKQSNEKFIIFTEYRATQIYLQWMLQQENIKSVLYRGGFKKGKKDWMRHLFQNYAQVMIATEAAGEGINLQFCHHLINYDLPWNPMRLEQRIGRIHRFGQENDVQIYNFAIRNTIDEHVIELLHHKINLFENVIGQLDQILTKLELNDLDDEVEKIFTESKSIGETKIKLDNLASVIHSINDEEKVGEA